MSGSVTYLYAISRPIPPVAVLGLRGIGGGGVRALPVGELTCVVSSVDPAEFDEQPLRRNLESLGWRERVARQHDDVVQEVAALATTAPLRLATVCRDDASAAARVHAMHPDALPVLAALDGREEWGVQLFDLHRAGGRAVEEADAVFARLSELAAQVRRHRPQDPELSGVPAAMVLNAAFLVDRDRVDEFTAAVDRIAAGRPAGAVVCTGPWPPYSFAVLEPARPH